MTLLEQSEGSQVVFSMPPILFIRTVRGEPSCLLDAANSLHSRENTLEKTTSEGNLPFLDLNINVSQGMWMTLLEQSEGSRVVFSMPPILFIKTVRGEPSCLLDAANSRCRQFSSLE